MEVPEQVLLKLCGVEPVSGTGAVKEVDMAWKGNCEPRSAVRCVLAMGGVQVIVCGLCASRPCLHIVLGTL